MKTLILLFVLLVNMFEVTAQSQKFVLGVTGAVSFSQIEGDNLRGFSKIGYGIGLLGGYEFDDSNMFNFSATFDNIGSKRKSEKVSPFTNDLLGVVNMQKVGILMGYSKKFGDSWDGSSKYHYGGGIKYNYILSADTRLISNQFETPRAFNREDYVRSYLSFKLKTGFLIGKYSSLDLSYEHGLTTILRKNEIFSRFIPFNFAVEFSYYIK